MFLERKLIKRLLIVDKIKKSVRLKELVQVHESDQKAIRCKTVAAHSTVRS